jgi:hypothetical protein
MIHEFNAKHGIKLASCYLKLLDASNSDDALSTKSDDHLSQPAEPETEGEPPRDCPQADPSAAAYSQMVFRHLFLDVVRFHQPDEAGEVSVIGTLKLNDQLHFHCRSTSGRRMWIARADMVRDHADAVITWYESLLGAG